LNSDHGRFGKGLVLLRETPWVPGDQAGPSDVTELQHQHDDALETNTSSTVGRATPLETVEIIGHRFGVDIRFPHPLLEEDGVVNALTTGQHFLTANEDIVRIGELRVLRIGHGVEGTGTGRELVCWDWVRVGNCVTGMSYLPRM